MPHDIRLAGPWDCSAADEDNWERCVLPFVVPAKAPGEIPIRIRRKFHKPSGVDNRTRLLLVVDGVPDLKSIQVNDSHIGAIRCVESTCEFDVSDKLADYNIVSIPLTGPGTHVDAVTLRIEEPPTT